MSIPAFTILTASTGMLELVMELTEANKKDKAVKAIRGEIISELSYRDVIAGMLAAQEELLNA